MSFQRIFEMAKRQGMPLVITDGQGRDPLIVLPLDMYEALADGRGIDASHQTLEGDEEKEPIIIPVKDESMREPEASRSAVSSLERLVDMPKPSSETDLFAELSMEERFYVESLEDAKNS